MRLVRPRRGDGGGANLSLEARLREQRDAGHKILAPYLTCGYPSPDRFPDLLRGVIDAGADLIEIGVPFSDPIMDGPVIQRASDTALKAEVRPAVVIRTMESLEVPVPFVYMTYVNPILAMGMREYAAAASMSGASGVIVPDLPVDEAGDWTPIARENDLEPIFLVAPTTTPERIDAVAREGSGFVYCVSLLGVTGVRDFLSERASAVVARVRAVTDRPALVGIGVSTPEHAAEACAFADGVVVGSALLKAVEDDGVEAGVRLIKEMRQAIDG